MSEVEANEPSAVPAVVEEQTSQVETPEVETEAKAPETEIVEAPSGETETTETIEPEKPKKNRVQERISELTRQREEQRQRAEEAERRARMMGEQYGLNDQEVDPYPTLESCGWDEQAHQQAIIEYSTRQTEKAVARSTVKQEEMLSKEARDKQMEVAVDAFKERSQEFAETQPDYYQKIAAPSFVQSKAVQEAMFFGENGPELAYYLASNPHETAMINQMSPVMAGMQLANIAAKLTAPVSVKPTTTPDPISPVVPSGTVEKDPDDMTMKEYIAHRRKGKG